MSEHESAEELRRVIESMQVREQRKDKFLGQLGHEIGNLMVPMQLAAQLLQTIEQAHPMIREVREILEGQGPEIDTLLKNLRFAARLSRGIDLHETAIDLREVARSAAAETQAVVLEHQHELNLALPEEPLMLTGDAAWLAQAVAQLLDNAARYSPAATRIGLEARREGDELVLRVRDQGPGLPTEILPDLFEAFVRGPREFAWSGGHLGVGLAFARRVVELHRGAIAARSGEVGAEFVIRLPAV